MALCCYQKKQDILPQENRIMKTSETPTIVKRGAYQKRLISLGGLKLTG